MTSPWVFITGASSGIGQALARRYYDAAYRLALGARRTRALQVWADEQSFSAGRYRIYHANVSVIDSIVTAGQACIASQSVPDVVVANAGISSGMDTAEPGDLAVMAHVLATQHRGRGRHFSSVCCQHRLAPQRHAGGPSQRRRHSGAARTWRALREQGGSDYPCCRTRTKAQEKAVLTWA